MRVSWPKAEVHQAYLVKIKDADRAVIFTTLPASPARQFFLPANKTSNCQTKPKIHTFTKQKKTTGDGLTIIFNI
jgi:hypothetical protein